MPIPNLVPLIKPLCARFPAAWKKAQRPHDDGEFNARVASVLYYELEMEQVGRNGKRGNPRDLSRDILNWKGEGNNPDPVNGGTGTIIDFIGSHEAAGAHIVQFYTDPDGPGAWVQPLTLQQIDQQYAPPAVEVPSYEALGGDAFFRAMVGVPLQADMLAAGQQLNDGSAVWFSRTIHSLMAALVGSNGQPVDVNGIVRRHRNEWRAILGQPPV